MYPKFFLSFCRPSTSAQITEKADSHTLCMCDPDKLSHHLTRTGAISSPKCLRQFVGDTCAKHVTSAQINSFWLHVVQSVSSFISISEILWSWVSMKIFVICLVKEGCFHTSVYRKLHQTSRAQIMHNMWCISARPATIHRCTGTSRYFCHNTNIVSWTSYRYIYDTFTYVSSNMGKHCLQLVLTLLPLFSPYARRFSEQTDKKNPCWAVFSIIFKMADTTNACVLPTRLVSCTDFYDVS